MTPEWIAVSLSAVVALASAFQIWQNTNIKLAVSKMETNIETRISELREWTRKNFVSKDAQLTLLDMISNGKDKS